MTANDASILSRRLEIHLMKNNFEVCRNLLEEAEKKGKEGEGVIVNIAELDVSLRVINILEKAGYSLLQEIEDIDVETLHKNVWQLGKVESSLLATAIRRAKTYNKKKREEEYLDG